jgi:hypothetical protein
VVGSVKVVIAPTQIAALPLIAPGEGLIVIVRVTVQPEPSE